MNIPSPSPRTNVETKKPIPTPRQNVKSSSATSIEHSEILKLEEHNTLTKRVSSASKQLAGDISQLVQDKKKAVFEGTRQSVRKITRRFSSASDSCNHENIQPKNDKETIDFFSTIRFNSPISQSDNIYNNVDIDTFSLSSEDDLSMPPPTHPPPPLPVTMQESLYDAPASGAASIVSSSSGNSTSTKQRPNPYESVFPITMNSKSSEMADLSDTLSTTDSWKFYDVICNTQTDSTTFNRNIENPLQSQTSVEESVAGTSDENSDISSVNRINSLYENQEIICNKLDFKRPSKSVIYQFDPLSNLDGGGEYKI